MLAFLEIRKSIHQIKRIKPNIVTNHIVCSFLTFVLEVNKLLKLSFLIIIQYNMDLQVGSSMKKCWLWDDTLNDIVLCRKLSPRTQKHLYLAEE